MLTIYSTKKCVYCSQVELFLKRSNVEYTKVFLDDNPKLRQELYEKTGAMTVPITTDDTNYVVGYNIGKLKDLIQGGKGG